MRKILPRRTFLRGAGGVLVALPFFEEMRPRSVRAQDAEPPTRLITMFFGLGLASKVVTSWFVVFFLVFFNTYKGGRSVERELVEFCQTLGASPRQILWRVRIPTAAAWTFASLPNAISFALIGVVLAEFVDRSGAA